jgi:glycosyltransferase involved in cell wall biosynthesis
VSSEQKKFSIVVPSYNQAKFIERTLKSIIDQGVETEIIVIDGGSTDGTVEYLKKLDETICKGEKSFAPTKCVNFKYTSEPDRGQSHALNKGFAMATGDIFGWQNSDDVYMPGAFKKVLEAFEKHPEKRIVYGNWYEIDEDDNVIDKTYSAPKPRIPHFSYEGFDSNLQSMFWKREVHDKFGKFDENLHQLMDSDFLFSVILNQGVDIFIKIDEFLGSFRRHQLQKTKKERIDKRAINEQTFVDEKYGFCKTGSLTGIIFRLRYAAYKFVWQISQGGLIYSFKKFKRAFFKRAGHF